jgi:3-methyladenine DNA glycosylase AlkC
MAERLKDQFFTSSSIDRLADTIKKFYPGFDKKRFTNLVFDENWESKELKEKMRHTTECLYVTLPSSFEEALDILLKAAPVVKGFEALSLPDYVALYGMENWDLSLQALVHFTKYSTSEMAVRPFLAKDPERVMVSMSEWAEDKNHNVRRFASEGCRPRLPWAMALPEFKKDPAPILPVLEKLKNDESEFVRRSVANNLNDISKDHPELVLDICERWYGHSENTDWIVKHACRGMLKAKNKRALMLFGFADPLHISVENLKLDKNKLLIGQSLNFSFELIIKEKKNIKVRLEYVIDFVKAKGKLFKKVFKIKECDYAPGKHLISRKHHFIDMSTRKHYPGEHQISIIVNGAEMARALFMLEE